ncbi:MAG: hypothetical protein HY075_02060 [Deltaproteobacteria bacterium]|nr:hypothetical protein [Deltaproteobacteria bacterium]
MRRARPFIVAAAVATALALSQGCSMDKHMEKMDDNTSRMANELAGYRDYVKTLTEQMKVLADSLSMLQKMSTPMFAMVMSKLSEQPPASTPDIDDVLKGTPKPTQPDATEGPQK